MNHLYYGDNLGVLRTEIAPESVDLIYLDPPFNSDASYNVLFRSPEGSKSEAQIEAFDDTWHWGDDAEFYFNEVLESGNTNAAEMLRSMRSFLGENDMMAYLAMMAIRLIELRRVLKPAGSLYLHCDPTASHYLKVLLDAVFGGQNFLNEISWQRSQPKSHATINFSNCRDVILRYGRGDKPVFNKVYGDYNPDYIKNFYKYTDEDGRRYRLGDLVNPNRNRPNLTYEFLGITRVWRWTKERMERTYREGLVVQTKPGSVPQFKRYLDEMPGQPITDDWNDIEHLHGSNKERLGYPTQKPLALLERIIKVSSNEGDVVLDPFCGCGTAIHAAEKLNRQWIGIDITHLAISLIEKRLKDAFPEIKYDVYGTPKDLGGAQALASRPDKYQFEWWAVSLVNAQPWGGKKKGADGGIDGVIYFTGKDGKTEKAVVQVKGGKNVGVAMIRNLVGVLKREKAPIGVFLTLAKPTREMIKEAASAGIYDAYGIKCPCVQILTIKELLDGQMPKIPMIDRATFRQARMESKEQKKLI